MKKKTSYSGIYIIALTTFFLGCFLLLVLFGTRSYRQVALRQSANNQHRALLSYLQTVTRSSETEIAVGEGEYGTMLTVADGDTGFGTRIYIYEGELVEDYGKLSSALMPKGATHIAETKSFEIEEVRDDLLQITTDEGSVYIHIREGGRP